MEQEYCFGCMRALSASGEFCAHCGWPRAGRDNGEFALPCGTALHDGKYLVGRVLGQGGFGITYIGLDRALEMRVAIKEYFPVHMASRSGTSASLSWRNSVEDRDRGRKSFVKEARKMAKIRDIPFVVNVLEVFYENETAYIVMDFLEGETLRDFLVRTGVMDAAACIRLLRPVLEALGSAVPALRASFNI